MTKIIIIGILVSLISCKNNERVYNVDQQSEISNEKKVDDKKFIWTETKITINDDCNLEELLNNSKIPKLAKELFENKAKNDDQALEYFEKLKSIDKTEREFYFKALTNLYKIADGSTSEGLGYLGLDYVEKNTLDFLNYFEKNECFSDEDLKTWSGILMLEFGLNFENENDDKIVENFISQINTKCKTCNARQKKTLNKFNSYLNEKWQIYLTK